MPKTWTDYPCLLCHDREEPLSLSCLFSLYQMKMFHSTLIYYHCYFFMWTPTTLCRFTVIISQPLTLQVPTPFISPSCKSHHFSKYCVMFLSAQGRQGFDFCRRPGLRRRRTERKTFLRWCFCNGCDFWLSYR